MEYSFYVDFLSNKDPLAFIAKLIKFSIKRKYNHVEIRVENENETLYFGSVSPCYRVASKNEILKTYDIIKSYKLKKPENINDLDFINFLNSQIGIKYAYMSYLWLLPMAGFAWLKNKLSFVVLDDNKAMNCCESVARPMSYLGYKLRTSFDAVEFEDLVVSLEERE